MTIIDLEMNHESNIEAIGQMRLHIKEMDQLIKSINQEEIVIDMRTIEKTISKREYTEIHIKIQIEREQVTVKKGIKKIIKGDINTFINLLKPLIVTINLNNIRT